MQGKRRQILDILKARGSATVDELRAELGITSVTVRHHLDVLRTDSMVSEPIVRRRSTPGRPQYEYRLTAKAEDYFPKSYARLALTLMDELKSRYEPGEVNVIFENVTNRLLAETVNPQQGVAVEERLSDVVQSLNDMGYVARWEPCEDGLILFTSNCPYEGVASDHPELCHMDLGLVSRLLGAPVERVCHRAEGDDTCAYLVQAEAIEQAA